MTPGSGITELIQRLPLGSGICVEQQQDKTLVVLPPCGFKADLAMVGIFMSVLLCVGGRTLFAMVEAVWSGGEHYWLGWVIGGVLTLIGAGGIVTVLSKMLARQLIEDRSGTLLLTHRVLGTTYNKRHIAKGIVRDIVVVSAGRENTSSPQPNKSFQRTFPLFVSSRQTYVAIQEGTRCTRIASCLSDEERQWLVDVLRKLCDLSH